MNVRLRRSSHGSISTSTKRTLSDVSNLYIKDWTQISDAGRGIRWSMFAKRKDGVPFYKSCSGIITAGRIACATMCIWVSALQSVEIRKCIGIPGGRFVFQHRYEALLFMYFAQGWTICSCFGSALLYIDRYFPMNIGIILHSFQNLGFDSCLKPLTTNMPGSPGPERLSYCGSWTIRSHSRRAKPE